MGNVSTLFNPESFATTEVNSLSPVQHALTWFVKVRFRTLPVRLLYVRRHA